MQDSPRGCALVSLEFEHRLRDMMLRIGINATVRDAAAPALVATLTTLKGRIVVR